MYVDLLKSLDSTELSCRRDGRVALTVLTWLDSSDQ